MMRLRCERANDESLNVAGQPLAETEGFALASFDVEAEAFIFGDRLGPYLEP